MNRLKLGTLDVAKERRKFGERLQGYYRRMDKCSLRDPNLSEDQIKVILQSFSVLDENGDGRLSRRKSFSVLDENGDGRLSRREVIRAYRLAGLNPTREEVEGIIKEHDVNEDGYIDFEEYFTVMKGKLVKRDFETERMKTAFRVLDTDQDGYLTTRELEHALTARGDAFTDQEVADIIKMADKNKDGKIDYEEFVEAELCKSVF